MLRSIVLPSVVLVAAAAHAQVIGTGAFTSVQFSAGSGVTSTFVYQNGVIGNSTYTTVTTGDIVTYRPRPTVGTYSSIYATGFDTFRVGPLPVEISNIHFGGNYKLVNSGGELSGTDAVASQVLVGLSIRQRIGSAFDNNNDPFISNDVIGRASLAGNGFVIDTFNVNSSHAPYVLTPSAIYYFQLDVLVNSYGPSGYIGPQIGTTIEFGGPLSAGTYTGFTSSFDYRTVPTPGSLAVFTAGLLVARRRR